MSNPNIIDAVALMEAYAQRTGLTNGQRPRRYLWTDAFAVCNFLGLARATEDQRFLELARHLVDQTHHTLGQHREDDPRRGWISGLDERKGEAHPTRGGLRIGKELPERRQDEPFDERLEWERDGQYFHYLAKWMHALDQVSRTTREPHFNLWARELAAAAEQAFVYRSAVASAPRMYWKMSIDLSRPLVPSMGQHDPLDGYITATQLRATAAGLSKIGGGADLAQAARQFATMLEGAELASQDPLGIGGLLADAYRVVQLMRSAALLDKGLLEQLLTAALRGLRVYAGSGELEAPAPHRLAFRELGLAIGMQALKRISQEAASGRLVLSPKANERLETLMTYTLLGDKIESFWRQPAHQSTESWLEHRDINEVMLATLLAPEGFLVLISAD